MYRKITNDIEVEVTPEYVTERSMPEQDHYFYAYKVTITNRSNNTIQIKRRHYIIRDGKGATREIEGRGVVGQNPIITPNQSFSFTGYCPLSTSTGNMRGEYVVETTNDSYSIKFPLVFFRILLDKWNQVS